MFGGGGEVKSVWLVLFWTCVVAGLGGFVAHVVGRADLVPILGAAFLILMGLVFLFGCYMSATTFGEAWVIGIGRVTRRSNPWIYWSALSIPATFGAAIFLGGIYWCIQLIRAQVQ